MSGLHTLISNGYSRYLADPKFRLSLETHRGFFLSPGNYDVHLVDDHLAYKYRYDLQGYLTAVKIPLNLHFVTMRLNNMTSPMQFSYDNYKALLVPSQKAFDQVLMRYKTSLGSAV